MSLKRILILLVCSLLFFNCTRDDICAPDQAVTPLLIINFKDFLSQDTAKQVTSLSVATDFNPSEVLFDGVSTDSIAIPLRTGADNTRYRLRSTDVTSGTSIVDVYEITYQRENIYINRACSFKTVYNDFNIIQDSNDSNNDSATWILDIERNTQTIENELQAHVTIFH